MKNALGVIKRWIIVIIIFAVIMSIEAIALLMLWWSEQRWEENGNFILIMAVICTIVVVLLFSALVSWGNKNFLKAGMLSLIAGILTFPVGIIALIGGVRIRSAARKLLEAERQQRAKGVEQDILERAQKKLQDREGSC